MGCVMWLVAAAAKGKTAACDVTTFGCVGGGVGLGFGNQYRNFPDGEGDSATSSPRGMPNGRVGRKWPSRFARSSGTRPSTTSFTASVTSRIPPCYGASWPACPCGRSRPAMSCSKPLAAVDPERENLRTIIFFAEPDHFPPRCPGELWPGDNENVIIPYAAGCQTIGIYPYRESDSPRPRPSSGSQTSPPGSTSAASSGAIC